MQKATKIKSTSHSWDLERNMVALTVRRVRGVDEGRRIACVDADAAGVGPGRGSRGDRASGPRGHAAAAICSLGGPPRSFLSPFQLGLLHRARTPRAAPNLACPLDVPLAESPAETLDAFSAFGHLSHAYARALPAVYSSTHEAATSEDVDVSGADGADIGVGDAGSLSLAMSGHADAHAHAHHVIMTRAAVLHHTRTPHVQVSVSAGACMAVSISVLIIIAVLANKGSMAYWGIPDGGLVRMFKGMVKV